MKAWVASYLAGRDQQHAQEIEDALAALTPREQALVKEAAVMGYVRGHLAAGTGPPRIPADSAVLAEVIGACLATPDLYPNIAQGSQ